MVSICLEMEMRLAVFFLVWDKSKSDFFKGKGWQYQKMIREKKMIVIKKKQGLKTGEKIWDCFILSWILGEFHGIK